MECQLLASKCMPVLRPTPIKSEETSSCMSDIMLLITLIIFLLNFLDLPLAISVLTVRPEHLLIARKVRPTLGLLILYDQGIKTRDL